MPRNDTKYRSLTNAAREHFTRHGAWPNGDCYLIHMRKHHDGIAGEALTGLRNGWAEAEKASMGLVTMLRRSTGAPTGASETLYAYIASMEVGDPEKMSDQEIFELITGPVRARRTAPDNATDYLAEGAWLGFDLIKRPQRWIWKQSRSCEPAEIPQAIEWMQVHIAYALAPRQTRESITLDQARPIAEKHMGISTEQLTTRVLQWHAWNPLIVRFGLGPRYPAGCTAVLPLTPEAYQAVRDGHKPSYECGPDDFVLPSSHLLVEIVTERVASQRVEACNTTLPLMASLHLQLAHLSAIHLQKRGAKMNLLSFAATSQARKRLAKQGFRPTGTVMPRSGVAIMERKFNMNSLGGIEAATVAWFRWLAWAVPTG